MKQENMEEVEATVNTEAETAEEDNTEEVMTEEAVEEDTEADAEKETDEEKSSGGFFKKKDKKDKKDAQIEELTDKVRRQMAEFENFRKRSEKEKTQMYEVGAKGILEKILPVVDNFERGLKGMEESEDPFAQGMQMIYKQLMTSLEEAGVKAIESVGQEFNPDFHNAVMHVEDDEFGENEIVEEFQKGYMYHDSVLRHSMVKVAN
ncbi:MAG: nucleotide exchange factor GrpE [Pseudobutyrivibrio sp.]|nr:nucleotide exchange factor GrpE [Pseudobutyrivibrio sp.]